MQPCKKLPAGTVNNVEIYGYHVALILFNASLRFWQGLSGFSSFVFLSMQGNLKKRAIGVATLAIKSPRPIEGFGKVAILVFGIFFLRLLNSVGVNPINIYALQGVHSGKLQQ